MDVSDFYETFFEEAGELLEDMERLLIELEPDDPDRDQLDAVFRAAHSIKGGAGTFGFQVLQDTTHRLENLLDQARHGDLTLDRPAVDVLLETRDLLQNQIEAYRSESEPDQAAAERICRVLRELAEGDARPPEDVAKTDSDAAPEASSPPAHEPTDSPADESGRPIRALNVVVTGVTPDERDKLAEELALLGATDARRDGDNRLALTVYSAESVDNITSVLCFLVDEDQIAVVPAGHDSAPAADEQLLRVRATGVCAEDQDRLIEELGLFGTTSQRADRADTLDLVLATAESIADIRAVLCFVVDAEQLTVEPCIESTAAGEAEAAAPNDKARETGVGSAAAAGDRGQNDSAGGLAADKKPGRGDPAGESTSVRVSTDKIDHIINLVGELIITQSMLDRAAQDADCQQGSALFEGMGQLQRNARDLQEAVMSVRMVPMDFVFNRFPRLVRDLGGKLGKSVALETYGGATELDKGLVDRIMDPMTHLVRNSLDHGIEDSDTRVAAGKPAVGRLTLSARHEGGNVVIEIGDDGAGLSRERILGKARDNGLDVTDDMADADVWQLIFAPGFSTAAQVSDVSGRGVGMDVVKRNILRLGGHVDLRCTPGTGTTVRIVLPLTLAIMDGMAVRTGSEVFILPLGAIVESMQVDDARVRSVSRGARVIEVRGDYLPLVELAEAFDIANAKTRLADGIVIVAQSGSHRIALFVDELLGQQQIVVKNLETHFRKVAGVSGATILGDGSVALILDAAALSRTAGADSSNKAADPAVTDPVESVEL